MLFSKWNVWNDWCYLWKKYFKCYVTNKFIKLSIIAFDQTCSCNDNQFMINNSIKNNYLRNQYLLFGYTLDWATELWLCIRVFER
jgi:hypothetical protein